MTEDNKKNKSNERRENIIFLIVVIVTVLLLRCFVFASARVNQSSMESNFFENDFVLFEKLSDFTRNYDKGDIIIFKDPDSNRRLIKRVIATKGDTLEIKDGMVYVNDVVADESYLDPGTVTEGNDYLNDNVKITIEPGKIFAMGDHRAVSQDCRAFGPIDKKAVEGTVKLRIFPFNKIRYFK